MAIEKKLNGYMTIEATFVITWTIFIMAFLIYLSFYSYDKCILFQDSYSICFRGSIQKDEGKIVPYINEHIKEQFGKKYFGVGNVNGSVSLDGKVTSVMSECAVKVPIYNEFTMQGSSRWKITTRAKAKVSNPTRLVRRYRMVVNVQRMGERWK